MFIEKETIELVRERASITDIVRRYVPSLKKQGRNYLGLCPFHKEKTPSFTVSPDKNIFKCFGCHTGGNVFTFISKIERLDFPESVKFIADIIGIEIREAPREQSARYDNHFKINNFAMQQYINAIKSEPGKKGVNYLLNRGVKQESIEQFKLGYAPESWDFLKNRIKRSNLNQDLAESLGLLSSKIKDQGKHYYDRFRNRLMFPIFDNKNRVVAFGGRIIGNENPKYINSPESELFKKRSVLYGFNFAHEHIREMERVIIVEGYLDVIGCFQEGVTNVVAPLGTALTDEQITLLSRYCNEIVLLFDSDQAGVKASLRSIDITENENVNVKVGMLPEGDPFDFIKDKGVREFMAVVDSAMNPVDYQVTKILESKDIKSNVEKLKLLFNVVKKVNFETEKSRYLKKISSLLHIDENSLRKDYDNYAKQGDTPNLNFKSAEVKADNTDYMTRSYHDLLKLLCNYPDLIRDAAIDFDIKKIPDDLSRNIFNKLVELYNSGESFSIDKMFDFFHDDLEMDFLNQCINLDVSFNNPKEVYEEIYVRMKIHDIDTKITQFGEQIKESNEGGNRDYLTEIEVLKREKEKLSQYMYNRFMH